MNDLIPDPIHNGQMIERVAADVLNDQDKIAPEVEPVDMSELAQLMLEWERQKRAMGFTEDMIKDAVLRLGKTQDVGNVRATYSKGRRELDYKSPGIEQLDADTVEFFTEHVAQRVIEAYDEIDWRKACQAVGIEPAVVKEGTPSVTVKLV